MPRLNGRVPAYRYHRHSGQAIVTLSGRDHYLGPYGTEAGKAEYDRLIAEWLAHGRRLPQPGDVQAEASRLVISINYVIHGFWEHA